MTAKEFYRMLKKAGCENYQISISQMTDDAGVTIGGTLVKCAEIHRDSRIVFPRCDDMDDIKALHPWEELVGGR